MVVNTRVFVVAAMFLSLAACGSKAPDISGNWKLNIGKSKWGKVNKPTSVILEIQHNEPALKYSGRVVDSDSEGREFSFEGAIDGREYTVHGAFADGKIVYVRKPGNVIASTFHSNDALLSETAETSVSADGKTLTRHVHLKRPESELTWTEIYDRQQ
ncbi:MAG: hypothetical protein ABFD86_13115 [Bryobacteraceae bacterium]